MEIKEYLLMKSQEFKKQAEALSKVDQETSRQYYLLAEAYYQQHLTA